MTEREALAVAEAPGGSAYNVHRAYKVLKWAGVLSIKGKRADTYRDFLLCTPPVASSERVERDTRERWEALMRPSRN